jgi:hypothetical protein
MLAPRPLLVLATLIALAALCAGCGSGGGGGPAPGPSTTTCGGAFGTCSGGTGPVITVQGRILYERLVYSVAGRGAATPSRAARLIEGELPSAGGTTCYGRTSTNASGDYAILVTPDAGSEIEVAAFSRTSADATHDLTVHEANPPSFNVHSQNDVFCRASMGFTAVSATQNLTVPYGSDPVSRPSIGFGALDVLVGQVDGVMAATGGTLPALHAYTRIGNNATLFNTSFYSHTARSIALLGGAAGMPDTSDTDYFDDGVIAHEFHHFAVRVLSHSWSRGGSHGGQDLEPSFAWGEGLATGFGMLMLGSRFYVDSANTNSAFGGSILFSMNVENATLLDGNGIGDEFTMAEILWDLGDGGTATGDVDADGVNVSHADLYAALMSMDVNLDGPYIGLFLERLVAGSAAINTAGMAGFLDGTTGPENQQISFPLAGADVFPTPIAVGGVGAGNVTSIPTGPGAPNPCRQRVASHWYHLTLPAGATVNIQLAVTPIAGSGNDLNLYLHRNDNAFTPISQSTGGGGTETINISLGAGTYIVRVEAACGVNNNANYTLTVN